MGSDASVRFAYHAIRVERVKKGRVGNSATSVQCKPRFASSV